LGGFRRRIPGQDKRSPIGANQAANTGFPRAPAPCTLEPDEDKAMTLNVTSTTPVETTAAGSLEITGDTKVGELAARHPQSTRVFARHNIDFCCGGGRPLSEACAASDLDLETIVAELQEELSSNKDLRNWSKAPFGEIIDHILAAYHAPLREELPRLEAMARKVNEVHGAKEPERLPALLSTLLALEAELTDHMMKEEQILFPMIRRGEGAFAGGPISVMEEEHESAGAALLKLRELTSDYTVPEEACTTWRALWHGLESLESELHDHIHLENNILFPRALTEA